MKIALLVVVFFGVMAITRCAPPKVSELLKDGVKCRARITMPDVPRGETVEVSVDIFECTERVPTATTPAL